MVSASELDQADRTAGLVRRRAGTGTGLEARRAALSRMGEALGALGVATWPAPGGQPVLSVWPGLHAGVSLDAERYGWTEGDLVVTWPADDATGAAHMVAQRLDIVTGAQRWRP